MKIKLCITLLLASAGFAYAAPLTSTTPVHAKPDASAPTIAVLNAGVEPELAPSPPEPVPSGWEAVEVSGEHDLFVNSKDITKSLDVRPGANLHTAAKADAPVFGKMELGDNATIVGVKGRWTQVKVSKKQVGYIRTGKAAPAAAATSTAAKPAPNPGTAAPIAPAPASPSASGFAGPGRQVTSVNLGDGGSSALPRLFQGKFASSRRALTPRRPYDFQLNDGNGERYAYLDVSKLLLTEQIDKYIDHTVVVYGTAKPVPNTRDIVIEVESLQLR